MAGGEGMVLGTWKSAVSVPPLSLLGTVGMYHG